MGLERPKFLSVVQIPTGGWTFKIYITNTVAYDTAVSVTLDAGQYYLSGDQQSDDLLRELMVKARAGIRAVGGAFAGAALYATIDNDHKVNINFSTAFSSTHRDTKIAWTECSADLAAALGFSRSADDTVTGTDYPSFVADWHHGFGWYADEDGLLRFAHLVDRRDLEVRQTRTVSGWVTTQMLAERFDNLISLYAVSRTKMLSNGQGYGDTPVRGYERNQGLECFWEEASRGNTFRFYRNWRRDQPVDRGQFDSTAGVSSATDNSKAWDIDPQEHAGRILRMTGVGSGDDTMEWFIESHTADTLTISADSGMVAPATAEDYTIHDITYSSYVLDVGKMRRFDPAEIPNIDRFSIDLPVFRYIP